ncbi:MAG: aminotransferase class V-fold PLP-dependent enzyme [Pseudomonadota bacterium]
MLPSQRHLFDIPRDVAYLSAASYSPLPNAVVSAGRDGVARKARPWLMGQDFRSEQNERARAAAARLINANVEDVALIPSVSYGFATAAQLLPPDPGSRVLVLRDDHSSPVLEWQAREGDGGFSVETIERPRDADWTSSIVAAIERPDAQPPSIVSISSVHWADGGLIDLDAVAKSARAHGSKLVVDGTQSVGVLPMDVTTLDPDFVVFPTYKWLLGPYARAFLYVAKRHQHGRPLEQTASGRRSVKSEQLVYLADTRYVDDARRFDMGERDHFISMEMASVGMELVSGWGIANVCDRVAALTGRIADGLDIGLMLPQAIRCPHILSLDVGPERAKPIAAALADRNVFVSPRIGRLRIAPHVYNDETDVDRFLACFEDCRRLAA